MSATTLSRGERRRRERELADVRPNHGLGLGWRLTARGRHDLAHGRPLRYCARYAAREHRHTIDIARLERESDEARARITTGVVQP